MSDDEGCQEPMGPCGSAQASASWSWRQRSGVGVEAVAIDDGLRRLREAFERRGGALLRVHLEIVDDDRMDAYHRRYSGVPGTTDVLTFCEELPEGLAVDLIVCADEAARRADEFGHPVEREVLLYAVHGILHCLGHDDHDPVAYDRMHAEEDSILEAAGIGATFRPHPPRQAADASLKRGEP
jgi:probable rRNA maturation factor